MPRPQLWVLLDAPAELVQARKREVPLQEAARQCLAYRNFIGKQKRYVIVDGAQTLDRVADAVERAIVDAMPRLRPGRAFDRDFVRSYTHRR
jgi:thymidylate kinase